jgi:hypothetical protein
MVVSRKAAGRIYGFLQDLRQSGVQQALTDLGLDNLVGQLPEVALSALTDVFCPPGGTIDESIAREAWDEAVLALSEQGVADVALLTPEQWQSVLTEFMTNSIQLRIFNDIGPEGISLPRDIQAINQIQYDLHELIRGAVDDAIGNRMDGGQTIPQAEAQAIIDDIYDRAFGYLEALEEE